MFGLHARDAVLSVAIVAGAGAAVAMEAAAEEPDPQVRTAAVGDISAADPIPMDAEALDVDQPGRRAGGPSRSPLSAAVAESAQLRAAIAEDAAEDAAKAAEAEAARAARAAERAAMWDRLADCESGNWDGSSTPIPGSRRWDYGLTFSHGDIYQGGVNFHPGTWDQYRDPSMPDHAGRATRAQQIAVAEQVLAEQGWGAWPVCSRKLGYR